MTLDAPRSIGRRHDEMAMERPRGKRTRSFEQEPAPGFDYFRSGMTMQCPSISKSNMKDIRADAASGHGVYAAASASMRPSLIRLFRR